MIEIITDKTINPSQLSEELGGVGLRVVGPYPDGTTKVKIEDVLESESHLQTLQTAIDAHNARPMEGET